MVTNNRREIPVKFQILDYDDSNNVVVPEVEAQGPIEAFKKSFPGTKFFIEDRAFDADCAVIYPEITWGPKNGRPLPDFVKVIRID